MIKQSQIVRIVAAAIASDAAITRLCERYKDAPQIHVGRVSEEALQASVNSVHIGIGYGTDAYEVGYSGGDREIPLAIKVVLSDEAEGDGSRITEYAGALRIDEICHAIIACMKSITGLGDELAQAQIVHAAEEEWPVCKADINCKFVCKRGTDFEPSV